MEDGSGEVGKGQAVEYADCLSAVCVLSLGPWKA